MTAEEGLLWPRDNFWSSRRLKAGDPYVFVPVGSTKRARSKCVASLLSGTVVTLTISGMKVDHPSVRVVQPVRRQPGHTRCSSIGSTTVPSSSRSIGGRELADPNQLQEVQMSAVTIRETVGALFRSTMTRIGARSSDLVVHRVNVVADSLTVGRWLRNHGMGPRRRVRSRFEVFDAARSYFVDRSVLYIEFGVAEGTSLRYWHRLLSGTHAELHGFDSFRGMPEQWNVYIREGDFDRGGAPPQLDIDTSNVRFIIGMFEDTLPHYVPPQHDLLIVNCDADIYSSTTTILNHVKDFLTVGSLLYFDEFNDRLHELRAFDEFVRTTGMKFRPVAASTDLAHILFERTA